MRPGHPLSGCGETCGACPVCSDFTFSRGAGTVPAPACGSGALFLPLSAASVLSVAPFVFCAIVAAWPACDCAIATPSMLRQRRSRPAKMRAGLCTSATDDREFNLRSSSGEKRFVLDDILGLLLWGC